jgi:hypothetical protein
MKLALRTLLLASVLASVGCTSLTKDPFPPLHPHWSDFSAIQGRHYANFPGKSKQRVSETKVPTGQTATTYLREIQLDNNRYFGTAWTQVPASLGAPGTRERVLELAAAEAVKSTGGNLVSKHPVTNEGIRGLTYVIDIPQTKTRMRQQIFLVTGVLVEQTYTGPAGTESERDPGRFFDSLKLLP